MRNVFLVGDELVAGHGDPKALGWAGRVAARTLPVAPDLRFHVLAVPGETTGEMTSRWDEEALRRTRHDEAEANHVLFAVGRGDVTRGVSPTMTRLNIANALDRAHALGFRTLMAGPPPGREEDNPRIAELAAVLEDAASRREVGYIDMYGPLARHDQWTADMATGRDALPLQAGYGLMAWLVLHSRWHSWLGIEPPAA
ncbi:GDSL-type esterase/lipase family protein [Demequina lignilytica]|uniref:GDSL-type esterase/lipase family protein n=1 Tax=Demequina lignilytica TaxID=3051663 RepID=A0AAW7M5R0_9MICO|nr:MULTISPECIES: GDSL-type esterase/lipase family protein [unclassified Demequina]MDN4478300.1 GDSL-type esterase/lipase family protein [Demequina sp. SYSU T00039-1]MDN4482624.1 GDSL-type esterase/lipase family protein [Demequina sp. SYSU T0a273]MDN4489100.1 GDSL-type esterase/lipase family protein [Demequina sp. SYSU T00039]MDN4490203.1 GDSL-type esterase/lipase family protein [Demequina sp. SYSU T00068]